jgi:UDP-N-acetylglucosamine transferase subunit ALG13
MIITLLGFQIIIHKMEIIIAIISVQRILDQFRRQIIIPSNKWTDNFQLQLGN